MIIIETPRLQLEMLNESNFENLAKLLANPTVHRLWPEPKTRNREQSRIYFDKIQYQYKNFGYSYWAVIRKIDKLFLGICGLLPDKVDDKEEVEVAYRISDEFWGHGYATEVAHACMEYAHHKLGRKTIISFILPQNNQSIRVAQKNGLSPDCETIHAGLIHTVWRKTWDE